ncbi:MAG: AAA family ATPase [Dermatophilaceae bacterium]
MFARSHFHGWMGLELGVTGDDGVRWRYELAVKGEKGGLNRPIVARERVTRGGEVVLDRPSTTDHADPERLTQTALEQISENKGFREIAEFLAATRYLHLVPQVIRDSSRAGADADDPFGGDFIARMNHVPDRTRNAWLRRVTEALQVAVPQFSSLEVAVDASGRPHLEARYTNWRSSDARQDERDLSDGTLRLIGLLWSLVEVRRRGAPVLLEEPELSLHPAVIRHLPSALARAQRSNGAQVILTTHSPELLADEGVRADEVLVLTPTQDGTIGEVLDQDDAAVQLLASGLTAAEVAMPRTEPVDVAKLAAVDLVAR